MSLNPPVEAIVVPPWIARREFTIDILEGYDGTNAIAVCDTSARCLAFVGPAFPSWHPFATVPETAELAALFDQPPGVWFAPRVRGLVISVAFAVRHGRSSPRDGLAAMDVAIKGHGLLSRTALRFLQILAPDMSSPLRAQSVLQEARAALLKWSGAAGRAMKPAPFFWKRSSVWRATTNSAQLAAAP